MKLHILSDLHNEFLRDGASVASHGWHGEIPVSDADAVVLAGDIDTGLDGVDWAIAQAERLGRPVLYVPGNHEFYGHEYHVLKQAMVRRCEHSAVHLLDRGRFEYFNFASQGGAEQVRILGATLWTDYLGDGSRSRDLALHQANRELMDHRLISYRTGSQTLPFHPLDALSLHEQEKRWLLSELQKPYAGKTVVVSHHAPHPRCGHPDFPDSPLGPAFFSDLENVLRSYAIDLWVYGHTHANFDAVIGNTRVVSNQAGYPGEAVAGFDAGRVVAI